MGRNSNLPVTLAAGSWVALWESASTLRCAAMSPHCCHSQGKGRSADRGISHAGQGRYWLRCGLQCRRSKRPLLPTGISAVAFLQLHLHGQCLLQSLPCSLRSNNAWHLLSAKKKRNKTVRLGRRLLLCSPCGREGDIGASSHTLHPGCRCPLLIPPMHDITRTGALGFLSEALTHPVSGVLPREPPPPKHATIPVPS